MFQLVLNSIQKTVNIVAPPLDAEVEFKYHCEIIKEYFSNEQNLNEINSMLIEDTQLPKHLNEIMRLLLEDNERLCFSNGHNRGDESSSSASVQELNPTLNNEQTSSQRSSQETILNNEITISTFMECLLSNKILEIIINSAKFDLPVGITLHTYKFLTRLIRDYKVNLLNHCSILNQINELISMCSINTPAGPYEASQIEFLAVIVNKIQLNYNLIHCFTRHDFPLLSSLISMLSSPDNEIADKSGQLLIDLVSIVEDDVAKVILNRTLFKNKIIDNLVYHYKQIPSTINPEDIETVLNIQDQSMSNDLPALSYQIRKFLTFFKWFSFLDQILIRCRSASLSMSLLAVFKEVFLLKSLSTNLFIREEINLQILSTILTFACLKHCKSCKLKDSIVDYLLNEKDVLRRPTSVDECEEIKEEDHHTDQLDKNSDKFISASGDKVVVSTNHDQASHNSTASDKVISLNKRRILIERCRIRVVDNVDHQFLFKLDLNNDAHKEIYNGYLLSLYSLQLFEEILFNKISKTLFEELFIHNLSKRAYLDISRYNIDNDLNELEDLNKIAEIKLNLNEPTKNDEENDEQSKCSNSLFNNPAIKSIKYFVALIPNELKSCNSDFGFEPYIEEAQKRFDDCLQVCEHWKWPKEIVDNYFNENKTSSDLLFVEADFISMLFDNLDNIIKIPYELNLQITSLITKIALFPHPNLNEYLLNPSLPLKENCRSLFSILHRVVDQLQVEVLGVKQLKAKLNLVRGFLLGETTDLNGYNVTNKDQKILEAIIIIEEFCKEIAATAVVKNTYLL